MYSPIKWVGGKSNLVEELEPMFPAHRCYVEVFGGAAWLLFHKNPSPFEILNDYDSWLMNFWSVVKNAKDQLIQSFEYTLVSRELFDQYKAVYKTKFCEDAVQKAHIFYYLVHSGFASDMKNPVFGTSRQTKNGLNIKKIEESINLAYKRLQDVTIENKSFEHIFNIYDGEDTFFIWTVHIAIPSSMRSGILRTTITDCWRIVARMPKANGCTRLTMIRLSENCSRILTS